jgi:4-amino-4-deoxy-L-arabinose transferase-like glycosyltransferase
MNILTENFLGYSFLLVMFFFVLVWSTKYSYIKNFLLTAFFIRASLVIFEQCGFIKLPDGNLILSDANDFELIAREFSNKQGLLVILDFFAQDSLLISRIISIFYTVFGESVMMAKSISVALGTLSVYMVYFLSLKIWNHESAIKAAWLTALFPSLILYSAITLREVYVVFFLLVSLIGIVKFIKKRSLVSILQIIVGFYTLSLFHGPAAFGGFIFLIYLILTIIKKQLIKLKDFKINISSLLLIIILSLPIITYLNGNFKIPYLGYYGDLINNDYLLLQANNGIVDLASHPSWLIINNYYEIIPKGIVKIFYFLYSPFIWSIKAPHHIIGIFDGLLYFGLTIYVFKNWRHIWTNPITRIFILLFIGYVIVYGFGLGNFGAIIRHRSKFAVILIILACPMIPKFIFSTKKKLYNK